MSERSKSVLLAIVLGLLPSFPVLAQADYPTKPVRVLLGIAAGGGTDLIARVLMPRLADTLGQPVIVENRVGAGGSLAAEVVAKSTPDGYTLLFSPLGVFVINPTMFKQLRYSPTQDFIPISMSVIYPLVVVSSTNVPARTTRELVDYLKGNAGKNNCGGSGATFELAVRLFNRVTGTDCTFIHYKGNNETTVALYSGDLHFALIGTGIQAAIKAGKVRGLAVTSPKRSLLYPELPSAVEAGMPDLHMLFWNGLFAPAGTSGPIVRRLESDMQRIVKMPEVVKQLLAQQVEPSGMGSEEFTRFIAAEITRWDSVRKAAKIPQFD